MVAGEIQRGAIKEFIRVERDLVDYVIWEGREKKVPQDKELDKLKCFSVRAGKQW